MSPTCGRWLRAWLAVAVLVCTACLSPGTTVCATGLVCPPGTTCNSAGDGCIDLDTNCGDGNLESGEECDNGDANSDGEPNQCRTNCRLAHCGDGIVDPVNNETCDDGNAAIGDGCSDLCHPEVCGNGVLDVRQTDDGLVPAEDCEDGNALALDGCTSQCRAATASWRTQALPLGRAAHAMAYDAGRGRAVLFGGVTTAGVAANDTWEWDGSGWSYIETVAPPRARHGHAMVYDAARGETVLFGGMSVGGEPTADTWRWDGERWENATPAGPSPPPRSGHDLAYDAARKRVVLFGGAECPSDEQPCTRALDDTWEWDGSAWAEVTPSSGSPAARYSHSMAYDAVRARVVLFGGRDAELSLLGDTWEWDGAAWTEANPTKSPDARVNHSMTFDAPSARVVLFGGHSDASTAETWTWDGGAWTEITPPSPANSPAERQAQAVVYDIARQRTLLFGGAAESLANDTWLWNGSVWEETVPGTGPGKRASAAMAYDADRARVVLYGGVDDGGLEQGDTWEWDGSAWTDVTPLAPGDSPGPRVGQQLVYDGARHQIVLFGGYTGGVRLGDTWTWDGATWTEVTPASPSDSPPPRANHALAYDAARDTVVLFGGRSGDTWNTRLADTWGWNGSVWTDETPGDSPAIRDAHAMTYDVAGRRVVLFGGSELEGYAKDDAYAWDGASWSQIAIADTDFPEPRSDHAMVYVPARGSAIIFGGTRTNTGGNTVATYDNAWEWRGDEWDELPPLPAARRSHAMAYDAARGRVLLFGGTDCTTFDDQPCYRSFDDTWQLAHWAVGPETCHTGLDGDRDGLIGCDDPDCWGYCTPHCPPGSTTEAWPADCDASKPRCGDGTCNPYLESHRSCPADCGVPSPLCGDFLCDPGESIASCPGDCTP